MFWRETNPLGSTWLLFFLGGVVHFFSHLPGCRGISLASLRFLCKSCPELEILRVAGCGSEVRWKPFWKVAFDSTFDIRRRKNNIYSWIFSFWLLRQLLDILCLFSTFLWFGKDFLVRPTYILGIQSSGRETGTCFGLSVQDLACPSVFQVRNISSLGKSFLRAQVFFPKHPFLPFPTELRPRGRQPGVRQAIHRPCQLRWTSWVRRARTCWHRPWRRSVFGYARWPCRTWGQAKSDYLASDLKNVWSYEPWSCYQLWHVALKQSGF